MEQKQRAVEITLTTGGVEKVMEYLQIKESKSRLPRCKENLQRRKL